MALTEFSGESGCYDVVCVRAELDLPRIGPVDLTQGTLSDKSKTVPTVTDNLFSTGAISNNAIGISYAPATKEEQQNGVLSWGERKVRLPSVNH